MGALEDQDVMCRFVKNINFSKKSFAKPLVALVSINEIGFLTVLF